MIRFGHIAPVNYLDQISSKGGVGFALGKELLESKSYREFFKKEVEKRKTVFVDLNIHEQQTVNIDEVINLLLRERVCTHFIIPDSMFHWKVTKKSLESFLKKYYEILKFKKIKLVGVCQYIDIKEGLQAFSYLNNLKEIDMIAIPFDVITFDLFNNRYFNQLFSRIMFLREIFKKIKVKKKIHLLGMNSVVEHMLLMDLSKDDLKWIYSNDSKLMARLAYNNVELGLNKSSFLIKPKKKIYLTSKMSKQQLKMCKKNIDLLDKIINK